MLDREAFLNKNNWQPDYFERLGISWEVIESIYDDYCTIQHELKPYAELVVSILRKAKEAHSLRSRIKNPEHLIKKLIRKKQKETSFPVELATYRNEITDLIGIRVLHLFKEQWEGVHDFITERWSPIETPTANIRRGDPEDIIEQFEAKGCNIYEHPEGYRSVHYLVKVGDEKIQAVAEIQVRTVIEEAWSEIDHLVRYPEELDLDLLNGYLHTFNRLAGAVDEMGSFVKQLKNELQDARQANSKNANAVADEFSQEIESLTVPTDQKEKLKHYATEISKLGERTVVPAKGMSVSRAARLTREIERLLPRKCPVCGKENLGKGAICPECRIQLEHEKMKEPT